MFVALLSTLSNSFMSSYIYIQQNIKELSKVHQGKEAMQEKEDRTTGRMGSIREEAASGLKNKA